jgi:cobalt-zinc-cadmium efflux system outer membrane protein
LPTAANPDDPLAGKAELSADILVEQVLARNPTLSQMVAAWQAASARYPQVTALDDPMFGLMAAPASIGSSNVEFGYRVEITQKLPYCGKRGLRGQSALAEASAAGHEVDDARLQLIESARSALADYYFAEHALAVNREGLELLRSFRDRAKERYEKVPGANEQDLRQADVVLGRQEQKEITLTRLRTVAVARMNTLMHLAPEHHLPPPPRALTMTKPLPEASTLAAIALERRPDLQALADRIRADEAALGLAEKEYYPDVEVAAAYDTIMGNGPMRDLAPQVGVRVNVPLQRGRRDAAVAEAQARVAQRRAELARQTDHVHLQVQEAYAQVRESERIVGLYQAKLLPAARANVKAAEASYVGGRIPFLSLIEAQRNVVELQDRYYEAQAELFRRGATLERVLGGAG